MVLLSIIRFPFLGVSVPQGEPISFFVHVSPHRISYYHEELEVPNPSSSTKKIPTVFGVTQYCDKQDPPPSHYPTLSVASLPE